MQTFNHLTNDQLRQRLSDVCGRSRATESELLELLQETERRMLAQELSFSSLYDFAIKELKMSESEAYRRIAAMRALKGLPDLKAKLNTGELTITNLAQVQKSLRAQRKTQTAPITLEQKRDLIARVENKSTREAEKELISLTLSISPASTELLLKETIRRISPSRTRVQITIDDALMAKLEKLKAYMSHKNPSFTLTELIEELADQALKKWDKAAVVSQRNIFPGSARPGNASLNRATPENAPHQLTTPEIATSKFVAFGAAALKVATSEDAIFESASLRDAAFEKATFEGITSKFAPSTSLISRPMEQSKAKTLPRREPLVRDTEQACTTYSKNGKNTVNTCEQDCQVTTAQRNVLPKAGREATTAQWGDSLNMRSEVKATRYGDPRISECDATTAQWKKALQASLSNPPAFSWKADLSARADVSSEAGRPTQQNLSSQANLYSHVAVSSAGNSSSHLSLPTAKTLSSIASYQLKNVIRSRYIPAHIRRQVWQRDQGLCSYKSPTTGKVCGSKHQLELDHLTPWALGGEHTDNNLALRCRAHNSLNAVKWFGQTHMSRWVQSQF
jgi:5-methylcytosine-specific restriction endonuclease McrA